MLRRYLVTHAALADVVAAQHKMQRGNWYTPDVYVRGHYPAFAQRIMASNGDLSKHGRG